MLNSKLRVTVDSIDALSVFTRLSTVTISSKHLCSSWATFTRGGLQRLHIGGGGGFNNHPAEKMTENADLFPETMTRPKKHHQLKTEEIRKFDHTNEVEVTEVTRSHVIVPRSCSC